MATYYFDASDAGPTDAGAIWTNDANAFNGNITDYAHAASSVGQVLNAEGTNAPTTGGSIGKVKVRIYFGGDVTAATYGAYTILTEPSGGWTWQKINDLEVDCYYIFDGFGEGGATIYTNGRAQSLGVAGLAISGSDTVGRMYKVEIEVLDLSVTYPGRIYHRQGFQ